MNLERTKPETLAAGVMDYMPSQSAVAHEYAERLNAALARLGLTDRLTLPSAPATAIDELPAVVDVPLRKTLSVFADALKETLTPYSPAVTISDDGDYIINHDNRHLIKEVILKVDTSESVLLEYIRRGGKFSRCQTISAIAQMVDFSNMDVLDMSYMFEEARMPWEYAQKLLNLMSDEKNLTEYMDGVDFVSTPNEAFIRMPDGFTNPNGYGFLSANNGMPANLTIDMNNLVSTGTFLGWTSIHRLSLLNTKQLKKFYNPTSSIGLEAFDCDSLQSTPYYNGIHNTTSYIGGFINLGKGFLQNGSAQSHTMMFDSYMQNLSHDSLVNIFNGLYDLNLHTFQFTNQPTIQLGATNYSRVSAAEIKIATNKGWIVTK